MNRLIKKYISLNRLIIINLLTISIGAVLYSIVPTFDVSVILFFLIAFHTVAFYLAIQRNVKFLNKKRSGIGRKRILAALMSLGSITLIVGFAFKLVLAVSLLVLLGIWTFLLICLQEFGDQITALLNKLTGYQHSIGVIGTNERSLQMLNHLRQKKKHSRIKYLSDYKTPLHSQSVHSAASVFSFDDFVKEKGLKELYISSSAEHALDVQQIIEEAERHCIRVKIINPDDASDIPSSYIKCINGIPVWQRYNEPLRRTSNRIIKRAADVVISGLVIFFILSWLIPLVGLLIKLDSKGPVFFKQLRSGKDNGSFMCLKFRSMQVNEESDHKQVTYKDSRITRIGAFLRKTSLDEFPQFINVFIGEMSIVGPRPHMLRHTEEYSKLIKQYMGRLYLKPGITGWAQVNGYRGETINLVLMEKRVEYDIEYMENWSLCLDIKVMALTFWNVLTGEENAY